MTSQLGWECAHLVPVTKAVSPPPVGTAGGAPSVLALPRFETWGSSLWAGQ